LTKMAIAWALFARKRHVRINSASDNVHSSALILIALASGRRHCVQCMQFRRLYKKIKNELKMHININ
jgi:hypothetical protein